MRSCIGLFGLVFCLLKPLSATGSTVLDFEGPLPDGLLATSYIQEHLVPANSLVTNQYLDKGVLMSDVALVAAGVGHAASGANALAGVDAWGRIDYDQAVTFRFFMPGDSSHAATTDFFAYSADFGGGSGNTITISAFDVDGSLVGQVSYVETGTFISPLTLSGIGQFHRVTVDQTLYNRYSGGIALDLVQFGELSAAATVAEPSAVWLVLAAFGAMARRRIRA